MFVVDEVRRLLRPKRSLGDVLIDELQERLNVGMCDELVALIKVPKVGLEDLDEERHVLVRDLGCIGNLERPLKRLEHTLGIPVRA
eukprot:scaffold73953_cov32-Tisochrysis_lutea.AAC.11